MKRIAILLFGILLAAPAFASPPISIFGGLGSGGSGGGGVPSIAGTANQITQTGSPGATTLSIPSTFIAPGTLAASSGAFGGCTVATDVLCWTGTATGSGALTAASFIPTGAAPTIGMYLSSAGVLGFRAGGTSLAYNGTLFNASAATGFSIASGTGSATAPIFLPNRSDITSGLGGAVSVPAIIVAGASIYKWDSTGAYALVMATDATKTDATVCRDTTTGQLYRGSGTLGICLGTSSERYKHDIKPLDVGLAQIMALQPKSFYMNKGYGDPNKLMYGFKAEDAVHVLPKLTGHDAEGRVSSFDYLGVVPVLVKAMQEQQVKIDNLEARLAKLEAANDNRVSPESMQLNIKHRRAK